MYTRYGVPKFLVFSTYFIELRLTIIYLIATFYHQILRYYTFSFRIILAVSLMIIFIFIILIIIIIGQASIGASPR